MHPVISFLLAVIGSIIGFCIVIVLRGIAEWTNMHITGHAVAAMVYCIIGFLSLWALIHIFGIEEKK